MDDNIIIFNGVSYTFDIILINGDGRIVLPKSLFTELYIEESFGKWAVKGYLVFDNSFEQLERYEANIKHKNTEFFNFRMDGSDSIIVTMKPDLKADSSRSKEMMNKFPTETLDLTLFLSVYDSEDLTGDLIDRKYKKLYFWDSNYNTAISSNQRVSCGEYKANSGEDVTVLNNTNRKVLTGDLLKYICTDKLGAPVSDDFESGSSLIYYTSNPSNTLNMDMQYLINASFADEGFPMWFGFDRFSQKFKFKSYHTLFENYTEEFRERIMFPETKAPLPSIAPIRYVSDNTWSLPSFSDIQGYKYVKMSAGDNLAEYNSIMVNSYDGGLKTFKTTCENGHILNAKEISKKLLTTFSAEMQQPLFIINEEKIKNTKVVNIYDLKEYLAVKDILEGYVALNDAISFQVIGLPNRTVGTFIELDSNSDKQGAWEDRFLGTWFVLGVTHTITTENYTNNILAVKLNIPNSVNIPDGSEAKKQKVETVKDRNAG